MIGKEIGHEVGQQTGMRVLQDAAKGTHMEVTFQAQGTLLEEQMQDIGTYNSWMEADGSLRGEGCGVVMGETEMATWEGGGVGHRAADGSTKFRGSIYYRSQSPKLSQLNGKCTIFEFDTDPSGKTEGRLWLWE